jgi:hypothetical protein
MISERIEDDGFNSNRSSTKMDQNQLTGLKPKALLFLSPEKSPKKKISKF